MVKVQNTRKLELFELSLLRYINNLQNKKSSSWKREYGLKQLAEIEILLRENNLEKKLIFDLLKAIKQSEKFKEYNLTLAEFDKILREKHVVDNIQGLIYEDIELFRDELLKLRKYILEEKEQNYEEWIKNENQSLRNLDILFRKIIDKDNILKKYFEDVKSLTYDRRFLGTSNVMSKWVGGTLFRIKTEGLENIPERGPAILAPKHVNSKIEPMFLKGNIKRNLHFLVSSGAFEVVPYLSSLMHKLGGLPVKRDPGLFGWGMGNGNNTNGNSGQQVSKTVLNGITLLKYGECLVIFPEGISKLGRIIKRKKTRRTQIGFVYFQVHMKKEFKIDVPIIPIGFKYSKLGAAVRISVGKPIYVPEEIVVDEWKNRNKKLVREYADDILKEVFRLSE